MIDGIEKLVNTVMRSALDSAKCDQSEPATIYQLTQRCDAAFQRQCDLTAQWRAMGCQTSGELWNEVNAAGHELEELESAIFQAGYIYEPANKQLHVRS